jgi:hypothetical protein
MDFISSVLKYFQRCLIFQERGNDISIMGHWLFFDNGDVAVENSLADHGIPFYLESEIFPSAEKRSRKTEIIGNTLFRKKRKSCGYSSDKRNIQGVNRPQILFVDKELDSARLIMGALNVSFFFDRLEVIVSPFTVMPKLSPISRTGEDIRILAWNP